MSSLNKYKLLIDSHFGFVISSYDIDPILLLSIQISFASVNLVYILHST